MEIPTPPESRRKRAAARLVRAVAVRLVVWGGIAGLLTLVFGNFWSWLIPPSDDRPAASARLTPPAATRLDETDWPHLRGLRYDAVSTESELVDAWPPEGPPVLWVRDLGRGYSGLIAVGGRVYTQTQTAYRQSVVCLDADSGQTLWRHDYDWPYEQGGMYPGPRATPTWSAGRVYFAGPRGQVGCLAADDGRPIWSRNVIEQYEGRGVGFGYSCSPLVCDGRVILPVGGQDASVVALNADDGSTVWATGDEPASYCGALPMTFQGRPLIVAFLQNALAVVDRRDGRWLWKTTSSREYDEHAAWPLYDEPRLLVASPFRKGARLFVLQESADQGSSDSRLSLRESSVLSQSNRHGASPQAALLSRSERRHLSVRQVWDLAPMSNDVASSVLYEGCVYGFDLRDIQTKARRASRGTFRALDFRTGKVRWSSDRPGHAALLVADGKLLMLNDQGQAILARATPDRYEELARADVFGGEICWTAPTLSRGRLFLRSPTRAACVYVGRPERLGRQRLAAVQSTSQIAKPSRWDLAWLVGGERPFPFDLPDAAELGRWYGYSVLGVLAPSALAAAVVYLAIRRRGPAARRASRTVFWTLLPVLAVAAMPAFNRMADGFVFTWPVVLFAVHQLVLTAVVWAPRQADRARAHRVVVASVLLFFAVGIGYFDLCRRLDLAVEWVFLIGFLPSWPVTLPAAYALRRDGRPWGDLLWALAGFTAYFWATAAVVAWRLRGG